MGWLCYHRNKQGLRVEPDESIAEHGENNKIEEGSSKLLIALNQDFLDSSHTNQSYEVLCGQPGSRLSESSLIKAAAFCHLHSIPSGAPAQVVEALLH